LAGRLLRATSVGFVHGLLLVVIELLKPGVPARYSTSP
jgi:hypothetical protein